MKYTVEQVRSQAQKELRNGLHATTWNMLKTYADLLERIKADESAVPAAWQYRYKNDRLTWSKWLAWAPEEHPEAPFPKTIGRWEVEYRELFARPPAQAAQVDSANWFAGKYPTTTELAQPTDSGRVELERWGLPDATRMAKRCEDGYWTPWHVAQAAVDALAAQGQGEPVAEVCSLFELRWAGADSISSIAERNGIKVGDKLYAAPPIDLAAVREVIESHINEAKNLRHDPESQDYLYEQADKLTAALQEKGNG